MYFINKMIEDCVYDFDWSYWGRFIRNVYECKFKRIVFLVKIFLLVFNYFLLLSFFFKLDYVL